MKKLIIIFLMAFVALTSSAQTAQTNGSEDYIFFSNSLSKLVFNEEVAEWQVLPSQSQKHILSMSPNRVQIYDENEKLLLTLDLKYIDKKKYEGYEIFILQDVNSDAVVQYLFNEEWYSDETGILWIGSQELGYGYSFIIN